MGGAAGTDRIVLEGMRFFGHHGHLAEERAVGSHVVVDLEVHTDLRRAGATDSLADTIDYALCFELVRAVVEDEQHELLEAVAARIAQALLEGTPAAAVSVRVAKHPPVDGAIDRCIIAIERARDEAP